VLADLVARAEQALAGIARPGVPASTFAICPWFRVGDQILRTIGMVARFDPVSEITLDELRVELSYPQDAATERFFRDSARNAQPAGEIPVA
jgi:hypothetical protein